MGIKNWLKRKSSNGGFVGLLLSKISRKKDLLLWPFYLIYTPFEGIFHKRYWPNNKISITINSGCNLRCINCYITDFTNGEITPSQIEKFVDEAISLNYRWDEVELRGGEATLHSKFSTILSILKRYKDFHPDCRVVVLTNGYGANVKKNIDQIPSWVKIYNSNKTPVEGRIVKMDFWAFTISPIDFWQYKFGTDFSKGCRLISNCYGLSLTKYGYYPVSPCVEVDKIFGLDVGIKSLKDVNIKAQRDQMDKLCRNCGFFCEPSRVTYKEKKSKSWINAFAINSKTSKNLTQF